MSPLIRYAREKFYALLKKELEDCLQNASVKQGIENCFITATNYWSELRATVAEYKFDSVEDEIVFFKEVKPLFTSELEYYSLLYHTLLFCPLDPVREKKFWERECKRLSDFKEQCKDFLEYFRSGRKDFDKVYYLRAHELEGIDGEYEPYDKEPKSRTSHDGLISKLWALERYNEYAQLKLTEVGKCI
jgi:hypothetical protein